MKLLQKHAVLFTLFFTLLLAFAAKQARLARLAALKALHHAQS